MRDINLSVSKGSLVAIIGDSGSGKSSLLHALLGELHGTGTVSLKGSVGYVPQKSWNYQGTIEENITDG